MKHNLIRFLCAVSALLLLGGCADGTPAATSAPTDLPSVSGEPTVEAELTTEPVPETSVETAAPETEAPSSVFTPRDKETPLNVLFIGNSFTYYNDMNQPNGIFKKITKAAGYNVTVSSVYKGGYYLHQFLDSSDSYGSQVLTMLKSNRKYDIVILQDQSANPISNFSDFYSSCKRFQKLIEENGGEMWLYATWGYKEGNSGLSKYGKDTFDMEMKLRAAYTAVGKKLGVPVIQAGAAMSEMYRSSPKFDVFHTDKKHPSAIGSTLIAWTIFGTVFGVDPVTVDFDAGMPSACARTQREIASAIIRDGAPVDPGYKTPIG